MDLRQLAGLWEENQECLKQRLGDSDSEQYGARWILMPEVPSPRFNHVSRIRVAPSQVERLLADVRTFFRQHGLVQGCLLLTPATEPSDLSARLYRQGFTSEPNPVMLWDGSPIQGISSVRVLRAEPADSAILFDLIRRVFFSYASEAALAMGWRGVEISYDIGAINYIAYLGSRPVGAGMLFLQGKMAGIYNMCTLPQYRGRGVARAILAACVRAAGAAGCTFVGLTPTAMGRPLYERVGFREIYQERYFVERL